MKFRHTNPGHQNVIHCLAFSPDGSRILTGSWDGTARISDVASGELLHTFGWGERVLGVAWAADGKIVAVSGQTLGKPRSAARLRLVQEYFSFSPDERRLMDYPRPESDATYEEGVWLIDANTGSLLRQINGYCGEVAFSPDGQKLVVDDEECSLAIVDLANGSHRCLSARGNRALGSPMFSIDGSQIAGLKDDGVWVFDAETGELVAVAVDKYLWDEPDLNDFEGCVLRLPSTENCHAGQNPMEEYADFEEALRLKQSGQEPVPSYERFRHIARFWCSVLPTFRPVAINDDARSFQKIVCFSNRRTSVVFLDNSSWINPHRHTMAVIDEQSLKILQTIPVPSTGITRTIAVSPDGATIAGAGDAKCVILWDAASGEELRRIGKPPPPMSHVRIAASEPWLAAIDAAGILSLHALESRTVKATAQAVELPNTLQFSRQDDALLIGSTTGRLELREVPSLSLRLAFEPARGMFVGGAFSPAGTHFIGVCATGHAHGGQIRGTDPRLVYWSVSDGSISHESLPINELRVYSFASSPDGRWMAILTDKGTYVGEIGAGLCVEFECIHNPARRYAIGEIALSSSNQLLVANCGYGMKLFDLNSKSALLNFNSTIDGPQAFAFTSDSTLMVRSGAYVNEIQLFDLSSGHLIREFLGHQDHVNSLAIYQDKLLISGGADGTIKYWDLESGELLTSLLRSTADESNHTWERLDG